MNRLFSTFALAIASALATPFASATVLTFDDIAPDGPLAANYGGLDWSVGDWSAFSYVQPPFAAHSGAVWIATGFADTDTGAAIGLGQGITFQGAWFSGYGDVDVTFELYDHGVRVGTSSTLATSGTPTWLGSGYAGLVDQVVVSSASQGAYAMDDLTFSAAVPEPGSFALVGAGLLALAVVARRRA